MTNGTQKKVCLVTGVGDGTGASIVRRFAKEGYRVAMLARNMERLAKLEKELPGSKAYAFDLADLDRLVEVCRQVQTELGAPHVIVHNAVRATFEPFMEADPEDLERNFRVNTTSLLYMARGKIEMALSIECQLMSRSNLQGSLI